METHAAVAAVFSRPVLLAHILHILRCLVAVEDAPARAELSACARVNRAFAAAAASDTLWRAALLRRWPATLARMAPVGCAAAQPVQAAPHHGCRGCQGSGHRLAPDASRRYATAGLESRYRFELQLFKQHDDGSGDALVLSATFTMRPAAPSWSRLPPDFAAADEYNRIATAAGEDKVRSMSFDLDTSMHVSRPLTSVAELRSLRSSLTVFWRCPKMTADALHDFAVLHALTPMAVLNNLTPPDGHESSMDEAYDGVADWHAMPHDLEPGIVRVMAAGELPTDDAGVAMHNRDVSGYERGGHDVTMQVCLDAEQQAGGGVTFPAAQRQARMVFTSHSYDYAPVPSRADVAEILGRPAWNSELGAA